MTLHLVPINGDRASLKHVLGFIVIQAIGAAGVFGLWAYGLAQKAFSGPNAILCWVIVAIAALGLLCILTRRWNDAAWIAKHVVRVGLLGTVVGLIIAFSGAKNGASADPSEIRQMISAVVDGMYVSLYGTLMGVGANLYLKANMWLLGRVDG